MKPQLSPMLGPFCSTVNSSGSLLAGSLVGWLAGLLLLLLLLLLLPLPFLSTALIIPVKDSAFSVSVKQDVCSFSRACLAQLSQTVCQASLTILHLKKQLPLPSHLPELSGRWMESWLATCLQHCPITTLLHPLRISAFYSSRAHKRKTWRSNEHQQTLITSEGIGTNFKRFSDTDCKARANFQDLPIRSLTVFCLLHSTGTATSNGPFFNFFLPHPFYIKIKST